MKPLCHGLWIVLVVLLSCVCVSAKPVHHYVFFDRDRERIAEKSFLETKALEGAQLKYTWRELEPELDFYNFKPIRDDLKFLTAHGKQLFIQLQDVSFGSRIVNVPEYLLQNKDYHGGAAPQYKIVDGDEEHATIAGWVARRWDPAVQGRLYRLFYALGKEFDGKITGINLAETSVDFGETGKLVPSGFTVEKYRDAVIENMKVLKQAFPKSVAMQYANFMPGEWLPDTDKSLLRDVYKEARKEGVAVGGPDLQPYKPGQMNHSYPLIRESAGQVTTGIAVQEGNYKLLNSKTKKQVTIQELIEFATDYLKVDYIFWCTEEPFYSKDVIPYLKAGTP
jgi:hypothetical protein